MSAEQAIELIRDYMEYGSIIMLSDKDRLNGINEVLKKYYNVEKGTNGNE